MVAIEILKYIKFKTKKNNLINGEEVILKCDINLSVIETYFNIKYTFKETKFIVEGLTEANSFDPFEYIEITYSGVAPFANASINYYGNLGEFSINPNNNLKNSNVINVDFICGDKSTMINEFGKYPSRVKKEFIVTGLDSYLDSVEKIKSDQYEKIVEKASSLIWLTGWGYYEDSKYICNICLLCKRTRSTWCVILRMVWLTSWKCNIFCI